MSDNKPSASGAPDQDSPAIDSSPVPPVDKQTTGDDLGEWLALTVLETAETGAVPVVDWRLSPVFEKPSITEYARQLWGRRSFIWEDAKAKAYQTTRGTFLGKVWLVLSPFATAMTFYLVFGVLLQISRGIPNFLGYLVIGFNFFALFRGSLTGGATVLNKSRRLLRAYTFPKASVVFSWTIRRFLDFIPVLISTFLFVMLLPPHVMPTWRWLLVFPVLIVAFVFALGLSLLTSALTSLLPDMKFIWPLIGRLWFYLSGVFFAMNRFDALPAIKAAMEANPGYVFLSMSRDLVIYETVPTMETWIYFTLWAVFLFGIGFITFWLSEELHGEEA